MTDFKGTAPGLVPGAQVKPKTLNMRCANPDCDSIEVSEIQLAEKAPGAPAPSHRLYRCVKCGHPRSINVGGHISI